MNGRKVAKSMSVKNDERNLRLAIVEDDIEIRAHLVQLVSKAKHISLVSDHGDAAEAIPTILREAPDIVLMDINLPGMNGIECTRILKQKLPAVQILMLTIYEDSEMIFESLKAGASGYLLKRTPGAKVLEAVREMQPGGSRMSSHTARRVVQYFNENRSRAKEVDQLTDRERAVLRSPAPGRL